MNRILFFSRKSSAAILISTFVLLLSGCGGASPGASSEQTLPTRVPTATAEINLQAAEQVGANFLDAWQRGDYAAMYSYITFNSREAIAFEDFRETYTDAQNTMTLSSLTTQLIASARINERTVQMQYNVTFDTNVLGQFSDMNRLLTLVVDPNDGDWRVAWSAGNIFAELGAGADLRFEQKIPSRANIYDRDGTVLADMEGVVVDVNLIRERIDDYPTCVALLAEMLDRPTERIENTFNNAGPNWVVTVGTIASYTYTEYIDALERDCNARSTDFEQQAIRRYPRGSLLPHVLGNVGYPDPDEVEDVIRQGFNAETILGRSGIERSWDDVLRGKPGGRLALFAPDGQRLRVLAESSSQIPESIWLTIDDELQEKTLEYLGRAYNDNIEGWGSRSPGAAAVVMEVDTGAVLAMASIPTYEGNAFNPFPAVRRDVADDIIDDVTNDERTPQLNRPALGSYPAGSIMKVVPSVALVDSGVYEIDTTYVCNYRWQYQNDTRFDWTNGVGHGRLDIAGGIRNSCNPFYYEAGFQLNSADPSLLPSYAREMGLGAPTGINSIAESRGFIGDPEWVRVNRAIAWSYSDAVNMAIGQGEIEVTPLQIARMYSAIANGGTLYRPQLVHGRGILEPTTRVDEPDAMHEWDYDAEILATVREGLCDVTSDNSGTAYHIFNRPQVSPLMSIGVCGKTGTAQVPQPDKDSHSWFVAYAPADDPEIVTAVIVEHAGEGSAVAAPIVEQIMEYYFFLRDDDTP